MANTRKVIDRIPEDRLNWKPHEKSSTMITLATHVASLPRFGTIILETDSFDIRSFTAPPVAHSKAEVLEILESTSSATRAALANASDEALSQPWALKNGDKTIFARPKSSVLRSLLMNHIIHHRAQLTLYLRMTNTPVPGIYGPSADE